MVGFELGGAALQSLNGTVGEKKDKKNKFKLLKELVACINVFAFKFHFPWCSVALIGAQIDEAMVGGAEAEWSKARKNKQK